MQPEQLVYVGVLNPPLIMRLNGTTGAILGKRLLLCGLTPSTCSLSSIKIFYVDSLNLLAAYVKSNSDATDSMAVANADAFG